MRRKTFTLVISFILSLILSVCASAGERHGDARERKMGILLVAFGTSVPEAQIAFENVEEKVKAAYPGIPVHWAYTSQIIRQKLAKKGKHLDSVEMALSKMMEEGFTHLAVQSLHTIGGWEYHDLIRTAHAFRDMSGGFQRILVGYPLLAKNEDLVRVAEVMVRHVPKERKPNEAVVLMGHGTSHPSNAFYPALMYHLQRKDPNIFLGTVEGSPGIDEIKAMLLAKGIKKAYLMPFMAVAGDHALNDLAGDEEDSWKSILSKEGITCVPILKGTAEYDDMVDIWVDHLKGLLSHFGF